MRALRLLPFLILLILMQPTTTALPYESVVWTELTPEVSPAGRFHQAMSYDSDQNKIILYGGSAIGQPIIGEQITWEYDYSTNTWSDRNASNSPIGINYHAMAYDTVNHKTIYFGGTSFFPGAMQDETYSYDYGTNNWTKLNPHTSPSARRSSNMVYDVADSRMVLFGGDAVQPEGGIRPNDDTWTYDYLTNNWTEIITETAPDNRFVSAMAYDSTRDQIILYGGNSDYHNDFVNDTWVFNTTSDQWTEINTTSFPIRGELDMIYDPVIDRIILYGGGLGLKTYFDELWSYSPETMIWAKITDYEGGPGHYKTEQSMVYNSQDDVTIFYGGSSPTEDRYPRTWSLKFLQPATTTSTTNEIIITTPVGGCGGGTATCPPTSTPIITNQATTPIQPFLIIAIPTASLIARRRRL